MKKGNRMDQLVAEFERLSRVVHVSTHLYNYIDNIRVALSAHPLVSRGPSYKKLSMSRYQRLRTTNVTMDGDLDGLRVMAVICSKEYLLPQHVKVMLPDLLSHRIELHEDVPTLHAMAVARSIVSEVMNSLPPVIGEHPTR